LNFLDRGVAWFWQRVARHVVGSPESLGIYRWVYGLVSLSILAPYSAWVDSMPRAFFDPPPISIAALFSSFPPPPTFLLLDALTLASLACVTIGFYTRPATIVFVICKVFCATFKVSFGKLDSDFLSTVLVGCMGLADWGACYSFDARRRLTKAMPSGTSRGLGLLSVCVAFGMLSAGLPKARAWIDLNLHSSGFLSWYLPNYYSLGRSFLLAPYALHIPPLAAELADYVAPLFEISGFIALLYSRRAWLAYLMCATAFHLSNSLVLNIAFHDFVLVYLAFVDWRRFGARVLALTAWIPRRLAVLTTLVWAMVAWHLISRVGGRGSDILFISDAALADIGDIFTSLPVCFLALLLFADAIRHTKPEPEPPTQPAT
jgi:hypothetical protein